MPAALPPVHAAAYVHELSADVRAVVVLDATGAVLAGPPALAGPAAAFLAAHGDAADVAARTPDGLVVASRTAAYAVVAVAGPLAIDGPTAADVRVAVDALPAPEGGPERGLEGPLEGRASASRAERLRATNAVISATSREM